MKYDVLLIVDVQTSLVNEHPYHEDMFLKNLKTLINLFREQQLPILYIRHDGGVGDELEYGTAGWTIYSDIAPTKEEIVIDKKHNSAFRQTTLREELANINAQSIVLCGMQSEYCIDTTCKVAFEYGYDVTIVKGTTTTFDDDFATGKALSEYYEEKIWKNRYANVISINEFIAEING